MAGLKQFKHAMKPIKVGPITLKNRIQFAPHAINMVNELGEPTDSFVRYVDAQARTGVGLLTIYATPVDRECGIDYDSEIDITTDKVCCSLVRLAEAAHIHDAKISIELVHAGRGADPKLISKDYAFAPSNTPIPGQMQNIKVMDQQDIDDVIAKYVDCSLRAKRCNFDMVMIHAAHGNLLAQFLSPLTNLRTDEYGGTMEKRFRFPLELLAAVRKAIGPDMAIEMRISGDEMVKGGMTIDEVVEFVKQAQEHIDLVHISAGLVVDWRASFYTMPPYYLPRGMNVPLAKQVKDCPEIDIPVSVVGGIDSLEMIDEIIESGSADIGVIGRALIADPELIRKNLLGCEEDVRPCMRCWGCAETFGSHIRCAVNPGMGMIAPYDAPSVAPVKKKVVVVGGGTAGMQAARTLVERGHEVVLFERSASLGGIMPDICNLPFKSDLRKYVSWAIRATEACGADIRLNTVATRALVEAEEPDAVFIAVGSEPITPPIPGLDGPRAATVLDVDKGIVKPSGKVVVCGGGVSGCECALGLAMEDCEVTVVDRRPDDQFALGLAGITRNMLHMLMGDNGVRLVGSCSVTAVDSNGVHIARDDGAEEVFEADWVVNAFGMASRSDVVEELSGIVLDTYVIGDANKVGNIKQANFKAYTMACLV